jgi:hypothetical protein
VALLNLASFLLTAAGILCALAARFKALWQQCLLSASLSLNNQL